MPNGYQLKDREAAIIFSPGRLPRLEAPANAGFSRDYLEALGAFVYLLSAGSSEHTRWLSEFNTKMDAIVSEERQRERLHAFDVEDAACN
jgi:hypothetical protein